jgi:CRP-like cAMP-binding protein
MARENKRLAGADKPRMGTSAKRPSAMDLSDIPLRVERLLMYRFLLRAITIGRAAFPDESCTDTLIRVAVLVGTLESRPLSATKIADYVRVPRETVRRRLAMMERRGIVEMHGTKASIPKAVILDPKRLAAIKEILACHTAVCRGLAQIEHKGPSKSD